MLATLCIRYTNEIICRSFIVHATFVNLKLMYLHYETAAHALHSTLSSILHIPAVRPREITGELPDLPDMVRVHHFPTARSLSTLLWSGKNKKTAITWRLRETHETGKCKRRYNYAKPKRNTSGLQQASRLCLPPASQLGPGAAPSLMLLSPPLPVSQRCPPHSLHRSLPDAGFAFQDFFVVDNAPEPFGGCCSINGWMR